MHSKIVEHCIKNFKIESFITIIFVVDFLFLFQLLYQYQKYGIGGISFFYDLNDTYMDHFNTLFWSARDGRYDIWESVYPPLAFLLTKIGSIESCLNNSLDPFVLRSCNPNAVVPLFVVYFIGVLTNCYYVVKNASYKISSLQKSLLIVGLLLSYPGLFALERGNSIVYLFAIITILVLFGNKFYDSILLAVACNIKPYCIICIVPTILKKKLTNTLIFLIFTVGLFFLTAAYLDDKNSIFFVSNMFSFNIGSQGINYQNISYTTTLLTYAKLMSTSGDKKILVALYYIALLLPIVMIIGGVLKKSFEDDACLICEIRMLYLIFISAFLAVTNSPGLYASVILIPLLIYVWSVRDDGVYLILLAALIQPFNMQFVLDTFPPDSFFSYLADEVVVMDRCYSIRSLALPLIIYSIFIYSGYDYITKKN